MQADSGHHGWLDSPDGGPEEYEGKELAEDKDAFSLFALGCEYKVNLLLKFQPWVP